MNATLLKFLGVGVINTCIGLGVIYLLKWILAVPDTWANLAGYAVGLVCSYLLNARFTFNYRERLLPVLPRFALVTLLAYAANLATVMSAIHWLHIDDYLAQALGVAPYTALSYLGMRTFVFPARPASATHIEDIA